MAEYVELVKYQHLAYVTRLNSLVLVVNWHF